VAILHPESFARWHDAKMAPEYSPFCQIPIKIESNANLMDIRINED
jgi:hypothetical protein